MLIGLLTAARMGAAMIKCIKLGNSCCHRKSCFIQSRKSVLFSDYTSPLKLKWLYPQNRCNSFLIKFTLNREFYMVEQWCCSVSYTMKRLSRTVNVFSSHLAMRYRLFTALYLNPTHYSIQYNINRHITYLNF